MTGDEDEMGGFRYGDLSEGRSEGPVLADEARRNWFADLGRQVPVRLEATGAAPHADKDRSGAPGSRGPDVGQPAGAATGEPEPRATATVGPEATGSGPPIARAVGMRAETKSGPDPAGPDPAGADPAGPDPADPDRSDPDQVSSDNVGSDNVGTNGATSDRPYPPPDGVFSAIVSSATASDKAEITAGQSPAGPVTSSADTDAPEDSPLGTGSAPVAPAKGPGHAPPGPGDTNPSRADGDPSPKADRPEEAVLSRDAAAGTGLGGTARADAGTTATRAIADMHGAGLRDLDAPDDGFTGVGLPDPDVPEAGLRGGGPTGVGRSDGPATGIGRAAELSPAGATAATTDIHGANARPSTDPTAEKATELSVTEHSGTDKDDGLSGAAGTTTASNPAATASSHASGMVGSRSDGRVAEPPVAAPPGEPARDHRDDVGDTPRDGHGGAAAPDLATAREIVMPLAPPASGEGRRAILRLPPEKLALGGLRPGDTVSIRGQRTTHARVLPGDISAASGDRLLAENCGAAWNADVVISKVALPVATRVVVRPSAAVPRPADVGDRLSNVTLTEGDHVEVEDETGRLFRARIETLEPDKAGRVGPETVFEIVGAAVGDLRYDGIAGLAAEIAAVHEMVESPLIRPDLFRRLGLDPPRGILFTGPPGSGKTLLARAVARRTDAAFFHVAGPEIMSKHYGESEAALRAVFEAAARSAPAVVFIDEIDAIAPRRGALSGEKQVERRVVAQLLTLLDGLEDRGRVVVMAATNMPDDLDPALRRPGRFDREIAFTAPAPGDREAILRLHLGAAPLAADADLATIAARAHGYVGADIAALAREAGLAALARSSRDAGGIEALKSETLEITAADLDSGFRATRPSALRAAAVPDRPLPWSDVGGVSAAKAALTETVLRPMAHPEAMRRLGLTPPRGILLVGPPGTGKTTLVRALATESGMNFMSARAATLLSQYLGEAERALADLFARARATAPTLLFLDELDGLAPRRGTSDQSVDRMVAQLLIELDGLEENRGLIVIAATNRAEAIDPALTRPGRFDCWVDVGLPDGRERVEMLGVLLRGRPLAPGIDIEALAEEMAGWSPAGMAAAVDAAARRALSRLLSGDAGPAAAVAGIEISAADFDAVVAQRNDVSGTSRRVL